jgi:hypothetical protein
MKNIILLLASLATAVALVSAEEPEAVFDSRIQPTFKRVFELGFRPSFVTPSSTSEVRDWDLHKVKILIGNQEFKCVSEMTTFKVFETGNLSRLTVVANRNAPIPVEDALVEAEALLKAAGAETNPVSEWREKLKSRGRIGFEGFGVEMENKIRVSVEIYPHGQGDKLASLAVQVEWPYDGKLPKPEGKAISLKTPEGYDWNMSYEEWSRRLHERGKQPPVKDAASTGDKPTN